MKLYTDKRSGVETMKVLQGKEGYILARVDSSHECVSVDYAWEFCTENINANREINLVNVRRGQIVVGNENNDESQMHYAEEVNPGEFLIHSYNDTRRDFPMQ